jgi:hypothetical protein
LIKAKATIINLDKKNTLHFFYENIFSKGNNKVVIFLFDFIIKVYVSCYSCIDFEYAIWRGKKSNATCGIINIVEYPSLASKTSSCII